jgi:hypothetical protein
MIKKGFVIFRLIEDRFSMKSVIEYVGMIDNNIFRKIAGKLTPEKTASIVFKRTKFLVPTRIYDEIR